MYDYNYAEEEEEEVDADEAAFLERLRRLKEEEGDEDDGEIILPSFMHSNKNTKSMDLRLYGVEISRPTPVPAVASKISAPEEQPRKASIPTSALDARKPSINAMATGPPPGLQKPARASIAPPPGLVSFEREWNEYFDPKTRAPYWHCPASGETTWINPLGADLTKNSLASVEEKRKSIPHKRQSVEEQKRQSILVPSEEPKRQSVEEQKRVSVDDGKRKSIIPAPPSISLAEEKRKSLPPPRRASSTYEVNAIQWRSSIALKSEEGNGTSVEIRRSNNALVLTDMLSPEFLHLVHFRNVWRTTAWILFGLALVCFSLVFGKRWSMLTAWALAWTMRILLSRLVLLFRITTTDGMASNGNELMVSSPVMAGEILKLVGFGLVEGLNSPHSVLFCCALILLGLIPLDLITCITLLASLAPIAIYFQHKR